MKSNPHRDRLDVLEAERMILTVELRNDLIRAARKLLPLAITQARGWRKRAGSPALLRLISRLAMRDVRIERARR